MALIWKHPFTAVVAGPSSCGKTSFLIEFLKHAPNVIQPPPNSILWCYGTYQNIFNTLEHVKFREGIPAPNELEKGSLLILDDLMHESDERVDKIFTKYSHHNDVSVIFLAQNLFHKNMRTLTLNSQYIVLFKNPRDSAQIAHLARQMFPGKSKYMLEAFKDATLIPYRYLVLDLRVDTDEAHRLKSGIFPNEPNYVYVSK